MMEITENELVTHLDAEWARLGERMPDDRKVFFVSAFCLGVAYGTRRVAEQLTEELKV